MFVIISGSRAAWLGTIMAVLFLLRNTKWRIYLKSSFVLLPILFTVLIFFKADSSKGRLHIYRVSAGMLKDNWLSGIGLGKFKARFNEYQADYFSSHSIDGKKVLLADNTFYAFNDYLQWTIETGITGFLLLFLIGFFLIKTAWEIEKEGQKPIQHSSIATLICISIASFFSYPMQIWQIQLFVLVCVSLLLFSIEKRSWPVFMARCLIVPLVLFYIAGQLLSFKKEIERKRAFNLILQGNRSEAVRTYEKLLYSYPVSGHDLYAYAQQLYYTNKLKEALSVLNNGMHYYTDNKCYQLKGKIEWELGQSLHAEKSFLRSVYMTPNRMSSRFELMNFYFSNKDTANGLYWAKSICNMKVKIPSERTSEMLRQSQMILQSLDKN